MPRPKKDNAEYFPHDADMRNDARIKALRKKFKLSGYAIWNMLIEYIADKDHFQFEYNDFELEIMAGDFDAEVRDIQDVISYCLTLGLLQHEGGFIRCKTLRNKLQPLLSKRKRDRKGVTASENPQSKVKKSKVEEYITHGEGTFSIAVKAKYASDKPQRIYDMEKYFTHTGQIQDLVKAKLTRWGDFIKANPGRVYNDDEHVYSSFTKFCRESPLPETRAPDPYEEARFNRKYWTDEAWRAKYAKQIQTDPKFCEVFQITQT